MSYYAQTTVKTATKKVKAAGKKVVKKAVSVAKTAVKQVNKARKAVTKKYNQVKKQIKKKVKQGRKLVADKLAKVKQKIKAKVAKVKQLGSKIKAKATRVVKKAAGSIKDAASATKKWAAEHKDTIIEVAAIGGAILAGMACTAATGGAAAVACMAGTSALINLAKDVAQGDIHSVGDALGSLGTGAVTGLAGGAGGLAAGKIGTLVSARVGTGITGRLVTEAAENGVDEIVNQSVTTGRVNVKSAVTGMVPGLSLLNRGPGSGVAGGMVAAAAGGSCSIGNRPKHSFDPATPVLMADGSKRPIEDVNVGDKVLTTDPATNTSTPREVTELHRNVDKKFSDVTVRDQDGKTSTLKATENHPFWNDTDKKWTEAEDLKPGTKLKVAGKGTVVVAKVKTYAATKEMRDLTVADIHTYYVIAGDIAVLVHNCGDVDKHSVDKLTESIDENTYFHYTDENGHASIMGGGAVVRNRKNVAYFTQEMVAPSDANNVLFAGNPSYAGRGSHVIAFRMPPGVLQKGTQPNEVAHVGSFRFSPDQVIYHGLNPFG